MQACNHYWGTTSSSIYMKYGNLTHSGVFHIGLKAGAGLNPDILILHIVKASWLTPDLSPSSDQQLEPVLTELHWLPQRDSSTPQSHVGPLWQLFRKSYQHVHHRDRAGFLKMTSARLLLSDEPTEGRVGRRMLLSGRILKMWPTCEESNCCQQSVPKNYFLLKNGPEGAKKPRNYQISSKYSKVKSLFFVISCQKSLFLHCARPSLPLQHVATVLQTFR